MNSVETFSQRVKLKDGNSEETKKTLIVCISVVLDSIVSNVSENQQQNVQTEFHAKNVPSVSIKDYLKRINKYAKCSQECFILALIYIDRITKVDKSLSLNPFTVHR